MTTVADTSVLIDHLRGSQGARRAFLEARASGERLVSSVLTKVEVLAGVRAGEEAATRALFGELQWIEVDDEIADRAGDLARSFRQTHPGVEIVDYVVAATAQLLAAELWTRNTKHFPMFPELAAPY